MGTINKQHSGYIKGINRFDTVEEAQEALQKLLNGELAECKPKGLLIGGDIISQKMARFAKEFVIDRNYTQAGARAGYSPKSSRAIAIEVAQKPAVQAMISMEAKKMLEKADIGQEDVVREFKRIGFVDARKFMQWRDGEMVLKASHELTDDEAAAIKEVYTDANGNVRLKFWDKDKALTNLAKYFKLIDYDKNMKVEGLDNIFGTKIGITPEMEESEAIALFTEMTKRPEKK